MAVTILGLAGSARRGGNTDTLLDWCLAAAEAEGAEVTRFRLCEMDLRGCRACDASRISRRSTFLTRFSSSSPTCR